MRTVHALAAASVAGALLLAHFVAPAWLWLAAFVGANLLQSSFTGFCPLAIVLKRLGVRPGCAFA